MEIGEGMLSFGVFEGKSSDFDLETSGFIANLDRKKVALTLHFSLA